MPSAAQAKKWPMVHSFVCHPTESSCYTKWAAGLLLHFSNIKILSPWVFLFFYPIFWSKEHFIRDNKTETKHKTKQLIKKAKFIPRVFFNLFALMTFRHNSSSLVGILNNFRGSDFNQSNFLLVTWWKWKKTLKSWPFLCHYGRRNSS